MFNNWISVKEKLPEYTDLYIVYCNIGSMLGGYNEVRAYDYRKEEI